MNLMKKYQDHIVAIGVIIVAFLVALFLNLEIIYIYMITLGLLFVYNAILISKDDEPTKVQRYRYKLNIGIAYVVVTAISIVLIQVDYFDETLSVATLYFIGSLSIIYILINYALIVYEKKKTNQ